MKDLKAAINVTGPEKTYKLVAPGSPNSTRLYHQKYSTLPLLRTSILYLTYIYWFRAMPITDDPSFPEQR